MTTLSYVKCVSIFYLKTLMVNTRPDFHIMFIFNLVSSAWNQTRPLGR